MKDSKNDSNKRERRHFTAQQKAAIVKAHLVDGAAISDLCDKHRIHPTQFYLWQKQLFENASVAFERKGKSAGKTTQERKIEQLQAKLIDKNEVIAELMEGNVKEKKSVGNSERTVGFSRRARRSRRLRLAMERADRTAFWKSGEMDRHRHKQVL